ncbi:TIM21-domain-containing protein [Massarina eburnea CBS 473.64]|uniref:Mitochondrial import inner membrane translocase subunit Tim21 n=1 Tax=Massarina eburnea CBS 473.64 TaxID=1395130 RepID=A0A6A6RPM7_9PLEO|nr:TIM21-domain-containing protein [Massarina eburnea CBS 473.64]
MHPSRDALVNMAAVYKPTEAIQLLRCTSRRPLTLSRNRRTYRVAFSTSQNAQATHSSSSPKSSTSPPHPILTTRRQVTVANDTGAVRWTDLSPAEKASRTVQQSWNFSVVIVGVVVTVCLLNLYTSNMRVDSIQGAVGYFLFTDILSPSSKTAYFNRATDQIRSHPECQRLLGPGGQISAHGENSWSRWERNRHMTSTKETDQWGTEHLKFRFYVEGPNGQGTVHAHLTKRPSQNDFEWHILAVDIKGHHRIYLENADEKRGSRAAPKIFGARWW